MREVQRLPVWIKAPCRSIHSGGLRIEPCVETVHALSNALDIPLQAFFEIY